MQLVVSFASGALLVPHNRGLALGMTQTGFDGIKGTAERISVYPYNISHASLVWWSVTKLSIEPLGIQRWITGFI